MNRKEQLGEHLKAAIKGINESRTVELFGKTWQTFAVNYGTQDDSVELKLIPVLGAPTVDKPAGGAPLELEGLKFTAGARGIKLQGPAHTRIPYGLTWKAAAKLAAWLCVEVDKHRAPVAPTVGQLIQQGYLKASDSPMWAGRCSQVDLSPEALTAAVWSGEGPPPVGCVCEVIVDGGAPGRGLITYTAGNLVCWKWKEQADDEECCAYIHRLSFRPLRTAEQLAAEAREAAIDSLIASAARLSNRTPGQMHRAFWAAWYDSQDA